MSPGDGSNAEAFEQGDEALDEADRLDPGAMEERQIDPSLDPAREVDEMELKEVGADLDDPDEAGWELDDAIDGPSATEGRD